MATKKVKRYDEGGEITEGENVNIDDETRARARKFVADNEDTSDIEKPKSSTAKPSTAKSKMVTKEELAKSGLSLRDYMNKQQGLTRRGLSKEREDVVDRESQGDAMAMRNKPRRSAEQLDTYANQNKSAVDRIPRDKSTVSEGESASGSELGRNIKNTMSAMAGARIPAGIAKAPAKEVLSAGRALATKGADEAIYLGKTAARRIEPEAKRLASAAGKRISGSDAKKIANKPSALANGGSVSRRGDGIATKGKTRGRMC